MAEHPSTQKESPDGINPKPEEGGHPQETPVAPPSPTSDCTGDEEMVVDLSEQFRKMHTADVVNLVALVLTDIVERNDKMPFSSDKLTRFHSRAAPAISIRDYIMRVVQYCNLEKAMLIVCIYFADLFSDSYANFTLNSLTVHRFLITAFTVASKGLCDQFCSNTLYARVGGLSAMELNLLEVEFLVRVQYRIVPPLPVVEEIYKQVEAMQDSPKFKKSVSTQRKHVLDEHSEEHRKGEPRPPGKPTGNKGLKAMKDTFKFLQKKK